MDELQRAQDDVGRALDKARAGEDPELAARVRESGEQLVNLLYGLLRMSRVHSPTNHAFDQPVVELARVLTRLHELLGTLHLVAVDDQVYLNEIRIRTTAQQKAGRGLSDELSPHNLGGLRFLTVPDVTQLRALLACLVARPPADRPRAALRDACALAGITGVELPPLHRLRLADEERVLKDPTRLPVRLVELVDELWDNAAAARAPNLLPLRRAITELLDVGLDTPVFWADVPDASLHGQHALRVALVSLVVGEALGLTPGLLQDLGVAALVHDIGYATTTRHEHHPGEGARVLLRQAGFHEGKTRRVLATLYHHHDAKDPRGPSLFGRLVRLADDYDTLVRPLGRAVPPPQALAMLVAGAGTRYDPVLVQLLVNRLGRVPPGTWLRLGDGRVLRTVGLARSPEKWAAPLAQVERLADGRMPPAPIVVDLAIEKLSGRLLPGPPPPA